MNNTRTDQLCYMNIKNKTVHLMCVQTHITLTNKNVKALEQALSILSHSFIAKSV